MMKVFWAYTRDGTQFDGCCATDEGMARLTIIDKYSASSEADMLDGMSIVEMSDVRPLDQWSIEQLARENRIAPSAETLRRLTDAIDATTERRAAIRDLARRQEANAAYLAGDIE